MIKYKRIIAVIMSCILFWNCSSYLVNAQEIEAESVEISDTETVEETTEEATENAVGTGMGLQKKPQIGISNVSAANIVETQEKYIRNLLIEADTVKNELKLSWENEETVVCDGAEVVLYTKEDKSDKTPVIVKVDGENELILNKENTNDRLQTGTVYYIDVKAYKVAENTRYYGKTLSAAAVLLDTPVVSATAEDAQYSLSWNKVAGATSYVICNADTGKEIQNTTENNVTVTEVANDVAHNVMVKAIAEFTIAETDMTIEYDETKYIYESESEIVTVTPQIVTPAVVTGVKIAPYHLGAILSWDASELATSYDVRRYDSTSNKWTIVKETTDTTYTDTGLVEGRIYYYKIVAVRTSGGVTAKSGVSSEVAVKGKKYLTGAVHPMYYGASCKITCPMYTTSTATKSVGKLQKGTKVTVISTSVGNRTLIELSNGNRYYISKGRLNYTSCKYTTMDYTTQVKEDFINDKGYWSKTGYLIWISSYTQKVNVFTGSQGNWKLHKTYKCATGKATTRTIRGTFRVHGKASRYGGTTYEKWVTFFYDVNSFHSRLYRNGKIVDARIGQPASNGCIRMYTDECYWIYQNIPLETCVVSY